MPYITSMEKRAFQKGFREGLLISIKAVLQVKFGAEGNKLLPEISQIQDVDVLETILSGITTTNTLQELREIYL